MSKGALRAQRAQARAKQMRQNLLGTNILNMSMYNAQAQAQAPAQAHAQSNQPQVIPHHPGAQYALTETYMPIGYDMEGRSILPSGFLDQDIYPNQGIYATAAGMGPDGGDMYCLPPMDQAIIGGGMAHDGLWIGSNNDENGVDYWNGTEGPGHLNSHIQNHQQPHDPSVSTEADYHSQRHGYGYSEPGPGMDYHLPPLVDTSGHGAGSGPGHAVDFGIMNYRHEDEEGEDPRMRDWGKEGLQTPSGHVLFNERLFDGALGSAGVQQHSERTDEGLVGFGEAIAQANQV